MLARDGGAQGDQEFVSCFHHASFIVLTDDSSSKAPSACWNPEPKPDTPNLLVRLPPELRNRIYEIVIPPPSRLNTNFGTKSSMPALLKVSRQIRSEAFPMFFASKVFTICRSIQSRGGFNDAIQQCRNVIETRNGWPCLNFLIILPDSAEEIWCHLRNLLPLLHLMRETGFEPDREFVAGNPLKVVDKIRSIKSGCRVFTSPGRLVLRHVLGRIIALGRRARDEMWSRDKLEAQFEGLVEFAVRRPRRTGRIPAKWPGHF